MTPHAASTAREIRRCAVERTTIGTARIALLFSAPATATARMRSIQGSGLAMHRRMVAAVSSSSARSAAKRAPDIVQCSGAS